MKEKLYVEVGYGLSNSDVYKKEEISNKIVEPEVLEQILINNVRNAALTLCAKEEEIKIDYAVQLFVNKSDVYKSVDQDGISYYAFEKKSDILDNIVALRATRISSNNDNMSFSVDEQGGLHRVICSYDSLVNVFERLNLSPIDTKFKKIKNVVTYGDPYKICLEQQESFTRKRV